MLNDRKDPDMPLNPTILFLPSWYPTIENPSHGIFIQNHAKALAQFTPVIVVYAYSTNSKPDKEIQVNTNGNLIELILPYQKTNISFPFLKQYLQFGNYHLAYKTLLHYLIQKKIKINAIQVNVVFPASIILSLFKNHFKVKHTIVEHWSGYLPEDGNYKGTVLKHYTKQCFKTAKKIWYISEKQKQSLLHHNLTGNFELLYNAIETNIFKPSAQTKNLTVTFLHVSSLVEREKNLTGTFKALKKLQDKNFKFELVIIGGDTNSIEVTKVLQNKIGLENVIYKGHQSQETINQYMNTGHALLLFSYFEGMPVVVLEALACGLPVFGSNVGQLPEIINNDFGRLSEKNNVEDFTSLLENFIQEKYKFYPEKMRQFILDHASFEAVGKQMHDFYLKD